MVNDSKKIDGSKLLISSNKQDLPQQKDKR